MTPPSQRRRLASDLSPEVEWYLETRGFGPPSCVPKIRTPEPSEVPGALFDPARVDRAIRALRALRHTKGKWAGTPIEPTSTQVAYIIAPVFGWVKRDSAGVLRRIIRNAYVEMPRKGAKTTLVSAIAMILGFADEEPGAEVLLGAASKDQAGAAYKPLELIVRGSEELSEQGIVATRAAITRAEDGSFIKPVSSRGDLAHGANVHGHLVDELHVHKNGDLLEALESGTGARAQPLGFIITTADEGSTTSIYAQRRELIEKLAKRTLKAPAMYGVIFAADDAKPCAKCDGEGVTPKGKECKKCSGTGEIPVDPFAEETWKEANPLYPETPSPEFMASAADMAKANPAALASFLRLHLGIRSRVAKRYLDLAKWDRNGSIVNETRLKGRLAYGGLDLASVSDLTALAWAFPDPELGGYDVIWRFWLPEAALPALDAATTDSASGWVKAGWITLTPGDVTDYGWAKKTIRADLDTFQVAAIGYDRWNASQLVIDLEEDGAPMVKVGQGIVSLSAPMKELDRLVRLGTAQRPLLRHGGNPVARWMADNLIPSIDPAGNVKPDKAKSMEKIDGLSALITGLAVAMTAEPPQESAYEGRGLQTV